MQVPLDDLPQDFMKNVIKEALQFALRNDFATTTEFHQKFEQLLNSKTHGEFDMKPIHRRLTRNCDFKVADDTFKEVQRRCRDFLDELETGPKLQINDLLPFVRSSSRILVHGCTNLLALAVACAVQQRGGVRFYVTEGQPKGAGRKLVELAMETPEGRMLGGKLSDACTIVPDSAVGALMAEVDFVLMGACCVTEHGGLVHLLGSLQIATVSHAMNVPCYVLCETYKFLHIFPLSTKDLKQDHEQGVIPTVEFVPPSMITLVFSEKMIMPPSAIADEMFREGR